MGGGGEQQAVFSQALRVIRWCARLRTTDGGRGSQIWLYFRNPWEPLKLSVPRQHPRPITSGSWGVGGTRYVRRVTRSGVFDASRFQET